MSLTRGSKPSHTEPRIRDRATKSERKLARRVAGFEALSERDKPTEFHMPGSQNLRRG